MEQQEMKITPQDIIDKEFRVKFRGFDMAEVDSFLEEVAENLFKLTEENTVLNEKILALQQDLEAAVSTVPQIEFPEELENNLEDLKQAIAAISADLAVLKQDKPSFAPLENSIKAAVTSIHEATAEMTPQTQLDIPAEFLAALDTFKQNSETMAAEINALKEDRQAFDALKKSFEQVVSSAREAASSIAPQQQGQAEAGTDLTNTLNDFKMGTEAVRIELTDLKQEIETISGLREDIIKEVRELLSSQFRELEGKLFQVGAGTTAGPPSKKDKLLTAEIIEEPEGTEEDTRGQDFEEEVEDFEDDALEFLNEDDILDVDKLRNVFQSVLDDEVGGGYKSRGGENDETA
ncbi:MAG: DivIVA domain-containing protein, partial [Deltaproteobacteria bacterium]|nr:DivIVA domain-containing protein [Deltaproteobacteria bacterium]